MLVATCQRDTTPVARCVVDLLLIRGMLNGMAYCELCDMDREFCEHRLLERRRNAIAIAREF